jgi:hypothetical protein
MAKASGRRIPQISPGENTRAMVQNAALGNALGPTDSGAAVERYKSPIEAVMPLAPQPTPYTPPATATSSPTTTTTPTPPSSPSVGNPTGSGTVTGSYNSPPTVPGANNPTGSPTAPQNWQAEIDKVKQQLELARQRLGRDLNADEIKAVTGMDASKLAGIVQNSNPNSVGVVMSGAGFGTTPPATPPPTTPPGSGGSGLSAAERQGLQWAHTNMPGFNTGAWGGRQPGYDEDTVKNVFGKIASHFPSTPEGLRQLVASDMFKKAFPAARLIEGGAGDKIDFGGVLSEFEAGGVPVGVVDVGVAFDPRTNTGAGWGWPTAGGPAPGGGGSAPVAGGNGAQQPGQAGPSLTGGTVSGSTDAIQQLLNYVNQQLALGRSIS